MEAEDVAVHVEELLDEDAVDSTCPAHSFDSIVVGRTRRL